MEDLGKETEMDENTGCEGPSSDTKKVCFLHFYIVFCIYLTKQVVTRHNIPKYQYLVKTF